MSSSTKGQYFKNKKGGVVGDIFTDKCVALNPLNKL